MVSNYSLFIIHYSLAKRSVISSDYILSFRLSVAHGEISATIALRMKTQPLVAYEVGLRLMKPSFALMKSLSLMIDSARQLYILAAARLNGTK